MEEDGSGAFLMDRFGYTRSVDRCTRMLYERNKEAADAESRYVFALPEHRQASVFSRIPARLHTAESRADLPHGSFP